ncbi:MAG: ribonuclease III [Rickettsiales bacterium]|nr:ribonuclease III [Rickettsiales bacterium]
MPDTTISMEDVEWDGFRESSLVHQALTHPSCAQVDADGQALNNQRLEFLGDSVLGLVIAEMLYVTFPHEQEGQLARRLAALVCGPVLVKVAEKINLGDALIMSPSEEENDGRSNPSNLEDACEALIGALYLDAGLDAARSFISQHWAEFVESQENAPKDPKTALQEWAQSKGLPLPHYEVTATDGPAHAPEFTISVSVEGQGEASATGASKKKAERDAAEKLLDSIRGEA